MLVVQEILLQLILMVQQAMYYMVMVSLLQVVVAILQTQTMQTLQVMHFQ